MQSFTGDYRRPKPKAAATGRSGVREQSSDEVLSRAKQERAERLQQRQRQRAAGTIQRWWRGSAGRGRTRRRLRHEWLQQHGSTVAQTQQVLPAAQLAADVLAPVLLAYLPATEAARSRLLGGAPLPPPLLADTAALRGCFALLLRSLAATDAEHNLLGLAAAAAVEGQQQAAVSQLRRLLPLSCALLGAPARAGSGGGGDPLLQAAAGRLVGVLCDASAWKCFPSTAGGTEPSQRRLQRRLHGWLAPLPLLRAAAERLVSCLAAEGGALAGGSQQQLTAVLNTVVVAQLQMWRALQAEAGGNGMSSSKGSSEPAAAEAAGRQLLQVLATPGLLPLLTPSSVTQLTALPGFAALLNTAAGWLPSGRASGGGGESAALCLLGTLVRLAAGSKVSKQVAGQDKQRLDYLPPSPLVQQPGVASALCAAATALLAPSVQFSGGVSGAAEALEAQLWPFAEGTFASQLLELLPLPQFARLYHLLLLLADSARGKGGGGRGAGGRMAAARLLSALAFGMPLLPRLWRHLATSIGLPLEAPFQATRGWEVAALRRGIAGLPPEPAAQLGLFCRVYNHALSVMDDFEFHERQEPFGLAQQRAVAAALNTLVFCTQLPDAAGQAAPHGGKSLGRDYSMLQAAAPLLHRALYERDARRQFCPQALWLEPYHQLCSSAVAGGGVPQPVSGAAVVRALLAAADDEGGEGLPPQHGAAAASPQGGPGAVAAAAASRPAAVAAILAAAPQCIPFDERVAVFRALIDMDKERCGYALAPVDGGARPLPLTIRRGYALEDAAAQLGRMGSGVKQRLSITFISEHGMQEAGIDMGGLMKEFLETVVAAGFDPNRGLFSATPDGQAFPNPLAERLDGGLEALETLGLVLGRALYEGVLLDCPLAPFFVSRLQGRWPLFDELQALDPEVYRSLVQLKRYQGPLEDLCLDFTVESDFLGTTVSEELVPGGSRLAVTSANVLQYVYLVADWHLNKRLGTAAAAFGRGLCKVIPPSWLRLFSPREVNQLLGGGEAAALDVDDMHAHAQYSNGYSASSSTVKHFWAVVRAMGQEEQRALLKFVTSCSRAPLGGFRHLNPPFTIHRVDCSASLLAAVGGKDVDRLPTASTCSNTLKLPTYRRTSTLREKLLFAIKSGAGFDLS